MTEARGRLSQLRSEWPSPASWREVREEDPHAFRAATKGALLLPAAILATLLYSCLSYGFPIAIALGNWVDYVRPVVMVASMLLAILLWIFAWALLSIPRDTRSGIAFRRFAEQRDLHFASFGAPPDRLGLFFAEGSEIADAKRSAQIWAPQQKEAASLFRSKFALYSDGDWSNPALSLALASYSGNKNDPNGPWRSFRYLSLRLPRALPNLLIDARSNGSLRSLMPGAQRMSFEGNFDRYFTVYAPEGYQRDALELLTPDVMACLVDHGRKWDIEVIEDRLIVASSRFRARSDRMETTALLYFSELIATELGHQASRYSDPRAALPRTQIAAAGRRLRRRSTAWITVMVVMIIAGMLVFPFLLGWWLDS